VVRPNRNGHGGSERFEGALTLQQGGRGTAVRWAPSGAHFIALAIAGVVKPCDLRDMTFSADSPTRDAQCFQTVRVLFWPMRSAYMAPWPGNWSTLVAESEAETPRVNPVTRGPVYDTTIPHW